MTCMTTSKVEAEWHAQDLRERLIIAQAEKVKLERHIREVVRHPANRHGLGGRCPAYVDPADAVAALSGEMSSLYYVIRPGMKNRIKPGVLLARWVTAANLVLALQDELDHLE
jgi:hypothetical protein